MTYTDEDGPQATAAEAYQHSADLAAEVAARARRRQLTAGSGPVFVRVEYVEQFAADLTALSRKAGGL